MKKTCGRVRVNAGAPAQRNPGGGATPGTHARTQAANACHDVENQWCGALAPVRKHRAALERRRAHARNLESAPEGENSILSKVSRKEATR